MIYWYYTRLLGLFSFFILLNFGVIGCGDGHVRNIKDYRFHIVGPADDQRRSQIEALIQRFNDNVGFKRLSLVDKSGEGANSFISFREGILISEGKIGYGQWTKSKKEKFSTKSFKNDLEIEHGMNLEFDLDFFRSGMNAPPHSVEQKNLFLLFCHEVGHGLEKDHSIEEDDVMYPSIGEEKKINFDQFFSEVRFYLQDS